MCSQSLLRDLSCQGSKETVLADDQSARAMRGPRGPECGGEDRIYRCFLWVKKPCVFLLASLGAQSVKNPPAMQETWVSSLGWEDPLEKEMATHSSILAWRIPWTEEPGGLQSMGCEESDLATIPPPHIPVT